MRFSLPGRGLAAYGRGALVLLLVALAAPVASALSISGLTATLGSGNTADVFSDTATSKSARQSGVSVLSSSPSSFSTRYAAVVASDRENLATQTITLNARYTIAFQVNADAGQAWQVVLATSRLGALTIVDDGATGSARSTMGALTTTRSGTGTLSGSLNLAAIPTLTSGANANTNVSQLANAVLSGVGTGAPQTVTLNFAWAMSARSTRPAGATNGDEAAVRFGLDSALSGFSADDYPGPGGRTAASDGHLLNVTLIPEPAPWLLTMLGLLGLEAMARRDQGAAARQPCSNV